jgi:hypothetical protein
MANDATFPAMRRFISNGADVPPNGNGEGPDAGTPMPASTTDYDPEETYPEIVIGCGLTIQVLWLTPELAAKFLARLGQKQRNSKSAHLKSIVDDIRAGHWYLNGETIIIGSDGHLYDGKHRCQAVITAGCPVKTLVVRGIDPAAYATIDNSAKRSPGDLLKAENVQNYVAVAVAARFLYRYERKMIRGMGSATYPVLSPVAITEIIVRHPGLIEGAHHTVRHARLVHYHGAAAFCYYILSSLDAADTSRFFDKLHSGEDLSKGDPILSLRNRFISDTPFDADDAVHFIFKAWNLMRKGRSSSRIINWQKGDSFPYPA